MKILYELIALQTNMFIIRGEKLANLRKKVYLDVSNVEQNAETMGNSWRRIRKRSKNFKPNMTHLLRRQNRNERLGLGMPFYCLCIHLH
jgi:hypothetical protein